MSDIVYTKVDEAPELASGSFLPIIQSFTGVAGLDVGTMDISLAGRIISQFPERLKPEQQQPDDLALLGEMVMKPEANIIKLPNISASNPQIQGAVKELQSQGYDLPDYPEDPKTDEEKAIKAKFDVCKGSAVNPVLRQGNSDRRAATSVKNYAKSNPHSMGKWSKDSKTNVASMDGNDFRSNEKSTTVSDASAGKGKIEFLGDDGSTQVLKDNVPLDKGAVVDATKMSVKALRQFMKDSIQRAKDEVSGYFLERIETTGVSDDLWMKVINKNESKKKSSFVLDHDPFLSQLPRTLQAHLVNKFLSTPMVDSSNGPNWTSKENRRTKDTFVYVVDPCKSVRNDMKLEQ